MQDTSLSELRVARTVDDFAEALAFYRDVLGLPVRLAWDEPTRARSSRPGAATLGSFLPIRRSWWTRIEVGRRVARASATGARGRGLPGHRREAGCGRRRAARRGAGDTLGRPERVSPLTARLTLFTVLGDADEL